MNRFSVRVRFLAVLTLSASFSGAAFAQKAKNEPPARPMFVTLPGHLRSDVIAAAGTSLPSWNGFFNYSGSQYSYNMVGTAPSTNTSTTITTYIIPVKIVITGKGGKKTTFDPAHVLSNGNSVTTNTVDSPIFDSTTTYKQGGVDVGTTQYIDAFQRANFCEQ